MVGVFAEASMTSDMKLSMVTSTGAVWPAAIICSMAHLLSSVVVARLLAAVFTRLPDSGFAQCI
jgi:hypothetical protein